MKDLRKIFFTPDKILRKELQKELRQQGHYNTGKLEGSFTSKITQSSDKVKLVGLALDYAQILNDGTRPAKASFAQFPFVVEFFESKGYSEAKAKQYTAMTINRWMKEGMSTKASARFSKNGKRLNFIGLVNELINTRINDSVFKEMDKIVEEKYREQKSEII